MFAMGLSSNKNVLETVNPCESQVCPCPERQSALNNSSNLDYFLGSEKIDLD